MNRSTTEKKKMVRALVIGDLHYKRSNAVETAMLENELIRAATEEHPDIIVLLGDILDRFGTDHLLVVRRAKDFLRRLSKLAKVYVLIGNHDRINNQIYLTNEHWFDDLVVDNLVIVDRPLKVLIDNKNFIMMPYVPNGRFIEALETVAKTNQLSKIDSIFAHQEFSGCNLNSVGKIITCSTEGDRWLINYCLVISGHIHHYHKPQSNIIYVGTPYQETFNDGIDKAIMVFTFGKKLDEKRIKLNIPNLLELNMEVDEFEKWIPPDHYRGIKVTVRGPQNRVNALMKIGKKYGHSIRVTFIGTSSTTSANTPHVVGVSFSDKLLKRIEGNSELTKCYNDLLAHKL